MTHVLAESKKLSFSEVNEAARSISTRECARLIASNKHLKRVTVDKELDMEKKRLIYDALHHNTSVQALTFKQVNPFLEHTDDGLRRLSQKKSVKDANFHRIAVTEPMMLFQLTRNLCKLHVDGGNMGDAAAQAVGRLLRFRSCLRSVTFEHCGLSSDGIVAIGQFLQEPSMLKEVMIVKGRNIVLGNLAAEALAQGIEMNASVERIGLRFPGASETEGQRIFQALRTNTMIKDVHFVLRNELGRKEAVEAARLLAENTTIVRLGLILKSEHVQLITDALASTRSLRALKCFLVDANGIRCVCDALARNDSVVSFELAKSRITLDGIAPICRLLSSNSNTTLMNINLQKCMVEDGSYVALGEALRQNVSLKALKLIRHKRVTDTGVRALLDGVKEHPALQNVTISSLSNPSYQDEIDFYMERNNRAKPVLDAGNLPLSIWPHVLKRANDCRHVQDRLVAPNMLYFFVKEKCELFQRAPSSRKRKRTTDA